MIRRTSGTLRQRFRQRRYLRIRDLMGIESLTGFILDLGGGPASFFAAMFPKPEQVILVDVDYNRACQAKQKQAALHVIVANGGWLPLADCSIDMTVCNSVIEHVDAPDALAAEIRRVGRGYFLQTPNGDFPLETHSFIAIPFYNYIPWVRLRRFICKIFGASFEYVDSVRYLPERRLRLLFPEATITYEKILGLKKSF
ncbi:MAG: class I SAM-dependent methyltransferase, partial [Dehalococcoidia bacterium]|nr:class I SAM-dependent methyltransferase [Dehalococcoidia bacterium]